MRKSGSLRRTASSVSWMTVSVRRPRKSIFKRPRRSISTMLNWVTGRPSLVDSGTYSVAGSRVMTTPAAWVEAWRGIPSTFSEVSISSCT